MRLLTLIKGDEVCSRTPFKIIPAKEFSTLLDAHQIVEKAQAEAETLRSEVEGEIEGIKKRAYEDGYQEGLTQFNELILALDSEKKRLRHEMNQWVLPLVLKAAKKVVAGELQTHPETIVNIVLQAIAPILQHHRVVIEVNKADRDILEDKKALLKEKFEHLESLTIEENNEISAGGCRIKTEGGIVNLTLEKQWESLESAFERYFKDLQ